ncbi:hypothetical protein QYE76_060704 [Lolium multiflorum]|uniref:CCHC-type domain-containing protein n=1 Tax=Lolium multiflorum TaxID=4521 RepID=A0AAD8RZL3_LOLMU|nr:hypothetical protein QYE76_060704 [Lolium multiflorum]
MYSDEEDTEEYMERFEEDTSSSTADVEEHVELDTDYGSASITDMTDIEELYIDNGSSSMDDMVEHHLEDDIDELYIDNGSSSIDDMVEQCHAYDIDTMAEPHLDSTLSNAYLANGTTYEDRGPPRWHHHMDHQERMARTVIDMRHHMSFAATSHFMIAIDQHLPRVFDDTTQAMATSTSCATTTMASTSSRAYGLRCYKCKQQGHPPRECPNLLCEVCKAKGHVAWQCTTPSAKTLYFDKLQAQVPKMPIAPTLQDEELQGHRKDDVDPSLALLVTTAPRLEDDLGGDGVELGDHGILPTPTEAHGVEMVEHGNFPSTKEARGDEEVEPTPLCFIDELVPIPCENESHLAHLSESDSELSDFHPICEFECFRLEDMSDTLSSTEDEFPLMETMYMVHEDDDISPCLLQDGHVDHMDPPTATTPTSNESAFKGTRMTTSTATEHELTKRAIESYPNKDLTRGNHTKEYKSHRGTEEKELPWCKEERRRRMKEEGRKRKKKREEGGRPVPGPVNWPYDRPTRSQTRLTSLLTGPAGFRPNVDRCHPEAIPGSEASPGHRRSRIGCGPDGPVQARSNRPCDRIRRV